MASRPKWDFAARFGSGPAVRNPHKKIITGKRSHPEILIVRCKCMAEYKAKDTYYNYDPLGEASTIAEANRIYKQHLEESP